MDVKAFVLSSHSQVGFRKRTEASKQEQGILDRYKVHLATEGRLNTK